MSYQPINVLPAFLRVVAYLAVAFICGYTFGYAFCKVNQEMHPQPQPAPKIISRTVERWRDPTFAQMQTACAEIDKRTFEEIWSHRGSLK